jgi:hypothetical protein
LTIILGQIFAYSAFSDSHYFKFRLGVGLDRVDRAFRLADPAIDAFVRVDDEHVLVLYMDGWRNIGEVDGERCKPSRCLEDRPS